MIRLVIVLSLLLSPCIAQTSNNCSDLSQREKIVSSDTAPVASEEFAKQLREDARQCIAQIAPHLSEPYRQYLIDGLNAISSATRRYELHVAEGFLLEFNREHDKRTSSVASYNSCVTDYNDLAKRFNSLRSDYAAQLKDDIALASAIQRGSSLPHYSVPSLDRVPPQTPMISCYTSRVDGGAVTNCGSY